MRNCTKYATGIFHLFKCPFFHKIGESDAQRFLEESLLLLLANNFKSSRNNEENVEGEYQLKKRKKNRENVRPDIEIGKNVGFKWDIKGILLDNNLSPIS
jgi:hypothetical protein